MPSRALVVAQSQNGAYRGVHPINLPNVMHSDDIQPAVRELINRHIRSMDHAEVALQLSKAPDQMHDADAVATRHRWAHETAVQVLNELTESGLAAVSGGRYRLATDAADSATLAHFAELYHRHPVTLVRAIYAAPLPVRPLIRPPRRDVNGSTNDA